MGAKFLTSQECSLLWRKRLDNGVVQQERNLSFLGMKDNYVHSNGRFCLSLLAQSCSCSPCSPLVMLQSDALPSSQVINATYSSQITLIKPMLPNLIQLFCSSLSQVTLFNISPVSVHPFQLTPPIFLFNLSLLSRATLHLKTLLNLIFLLTSTP